MKNNPPALDIFILIFQRDIYLYSYNTLISFCVYVQYISYSTHWKTATLPETESQNPSEAEIASTYFRTIVLIGLEIAIYLMQEFFYRSLLITYDQMLNELGTVCMGKRWEIYGWSTDGRKGFDIFSLSLGTNRSFY